jgi:hypothetical protein
MTRKTVNSSAIASIGYDMEKHQLEIKFRENSSGSGGGVYKYFGVPPYVYYEFIQSDSLGSYYNSVIKKEGYTSTRVD